MAQNSICLFLCTTSCNLNFHFKINFIYFVI
nr:MAG TPA: hypothetical protein [Caudoviricetes sp.]